jgi:hypothetical protein
MAKRQGSFLKPALRKAAALRWNPTIPRGKLGPHSSGGITELVATHASDGVERRWEYRH